MMNFSSSTIRQVSCKIFEDSKDSIVRLGNLTLPKRQQQQKNNSNCVEDMKRRIERRSSLGDRKVKDFFVLSLKDMIQMIHVKTMKHFLMKFAFLKEHTFINNRFLCNAQSICIP
jgi:hypothetical protein